MFEERVLLGGGRRIELSLDRSLRYRLRLLRGSQPLVEYRGEGGRHVRRVHGREQAYEFKSVEKLRYDFERDAEDAPSRG